jgi:hypothetical protein
MARTIHERNTDALFAAALVRPGFARLFLGLILPSPVAPVRRVARQTPHASHSGSIDLEIHLEDGRRLLVENKIDAGYSVTRDGVPQPERYTASVTALRARGIEAHSVLLAPQVYLTGSRFAAAFNHTVAYEALRPGFSGADHELLETAIAQAEMPYEPEPNNRSYA